MSQLLDSQKNPRPPILRRAVNILHSNGRPANAGLGTIHEGQPASPPKLRRGGIGNSIRRAVQGVFREASILRRPSFKGKKSATTDEATHRPRATSHTRSQSAPVIETAGNGNAGVLKIEPPSTLSPPPIVTTQSEPQIRRTESQTDLTTPVSIDVTIPKPLQEGTYLTRVTRKKRKRVIFYLDPERGQISWESKIIPIECIKEIRIGSDGRYYRQQFQLADEDENRWITIVYILDGNYKTLHLIAETERDFEMWRTSLKKLHTIRQELMSGLAPLEMKQAIWEKQYWKVADEEADQKLEFEEAEKLCKRLNVNTPTDELRRLFNQADRSQRGYLDFSDFRFFVKLLKARPDIRQLYNSLRQENDNKFDLGVFIKFMREEQKSPLKDEELEQIFERYTQAPDTSSPPSRLLELPLSASPPLTPPPFPIQSRPSTSTSIMSPGVMSLDKFTSFLLSSDNAAFSDLRGEVCQDMTRPLPEYYISSSHNTYLVGHQLVGESTIEGYIRALLHSCRSVEVDIYDGEEEPMIFHGKTLTTKVSLREVCEAIAKYGFITSPYPIIISAEVHCNVSQQDMMVEIMRDVFKDALVTSLPEQDPPKIETLPSPEDLKYRILFKTKNLNLLSEIEGEAVDMDSSTDTSMSSSELDLSFTSPRNRRASNQDALSRTHGSKTYGHRKSASTSAATPTNQPMLSPSGLVRSFSRRSQNGERAKPKMSFALVALLVYTVGVKCRGINKKETYAPEHMFSLSEKTANKFLKHDMASLIKHNRTHLVRIYPKGTRLNSTNYEPHRYWAAGAQLVAINWQTFDLGYMINHAMFQRNGRAGYVLKPDALRFADKSLLQHRSRFEFRVKIISAQQLPRPKDASGREIINKSIIDPYVEVSLHVPDMTTLEPQINGSDSPQHPSTSACIFSYRTGAVKNNGFNPRWEELIYIPFECVGDLLDLVFVKFAVRWEDQDNSEPLALYCAPLGSLQKGYRHLPLHDAQLSQYLFSTLFVHIDIQAST